MATIDWEQLDANFQYYDRDIIVDVIENIF